MGASSVRLPSVSHQNMAAGQPGGSWQETCTPSPERTGRACNNDCGWSLCSTAHPGQASGQRRRLAVPQFPAAQGRQSQHGCGDCQTGHDTRPAPPAFQVRGQVFGPWITALGSRRQRPQTDALQRAGHARGPQGRPVEVAAARPLQHLRNRLPLKEGVPGQQPIEYPAQGEDVAARAQALGFRAGLLRGHVSRCTALRRCRRRPRRAAAGPGRSR